MSREDLPLEGYRVLDITDDKGALCTKLLADFGADVIKIEPPRGDQTRRLPPFKDDDPHPEKSLYFLYLNTNKRGITLNLETVDGRAILRRLIDKADVLVESYQPGYLESLGLSYPALKQVNPGLVMASITGFGQTGQYKDHKVAEIVTFAMGGVMNVSGPLDGPPSMAPIPMSYFSASAYVPEAVVLALYHRFFTTEGQYIDASIYECMAAMDDWQITLFSTEGGIRQRKRFIAPDDFYPCRDGYLHCYASSPGHWRAFFELIGRPSALSDPIWDDLAFRRQNVDVIDLYASEGMSEHSKVELYERGQQLRFPCAPVYAPAEYMQDPQNQARKTFSSIVHPVIGRYQQMRPPIRYNGELNSASRAAPLLGEHNEEIYCGELGFSRQQLVSLRAANII